MQKKETQKPTKLPSEAVSKKEQAKKKVTTKTGSTKTSSLQQSITSRTQPTVASRTDKEHQIQKQLEKGKNAYGEQRLDEAETIFNKIIKTNTKTIKTIKDSGQKDTSYSNNTLKASYQVKSSKSFLEVIPRARQKHEYKDIAKKLRQQGVKAIDITQVSGEDLFTQALKSWSNHQDQETIALLDKYISLGNTIKRFDDAQRLLKTLDRKKSSTSTNPFAEKDPVKRQENLMALLGNSIDNQTNTSDSGVDFMVLARLDRSFKSAINNNEEKYFPKEESYESFTDDATEDMVNALYRRIDHYLALFHNYDGALSDKQQGIALRQIIQPLDSGFESKVRDLYSELEFTVNQMGFHGLSILVESYKPEVPYENEQQLYALLKHHLKDHLLSASLKDISELEAEYKFYSDFEPYARLVARYEQGNWTFSKKDMSSMASLTRPPTQEELRQIAKAEAEAKALAKLPPKIKKGKYSQKQILATIKTLQKEANELLKAWPQYQSKPSSNLERRDHQTKMVELARDEIPNVIDDVLPSALFLLQNINKDDSDDYSDWDRELSKPIRTILDDGLTLWDYGFNNDAQSKAQLYYGNSSYTDPFTHAKIPPTINKLMAYQYDWVRQNRVGTSADPSIELPMGISGGKAKITYKEPKRIRLRLNSPTELFFEGIGQQAGQAGAAFLSYKGQLAHFEQKLKDYRKAYFECYPDCKNFDKINAKFSRLLIEKDVHYLKLAGSHNPLTDRFTKALSVLSQSTNLKGNNIKLLDGGIPYRCLGAFKDWGYYYAQALGTDINKEMNNSFALLGQMAKGNMTAMQRAGNNSRQEQQHAFNETSSSYGAYQICRDQWEFDQWEDKHGEFDEKSSWFGF